MTPPAVMSSVGEHDRVQNGIATAAVTLSDDRVAGDVLSDSYAGASFSDKQVGNGKPVSVSGIAISGTDAANYSANGSAATPADITPRGLVGSASGGNKVYDGTPTAALPPSD